MRRLRSMSERDDDSKGKTWAPRKYFCMDCGSAFSFKASLVRHRFFECDRKPNTTEKHNEKPKLEVHDIECELSIEKMEFEEEDSEKGQRKKHICPKCNRAYSFFTSLWRHQNYECGVEPKFTCPVCFARFAQKGNLDRHVRSRH